MDSPAARLLALLGLAVLLLADFLPSLYPPLAEPQVTDPKREKLAKLAATMKNSCLPKLICELNASLEKDKLTQKARSLLQLIRDTSMSSTAEVSSRYHFAAHMGQLIAGVEGTGCHFFYPACPLPSAKVLSLVNKPSLF